MSSSVFFFFFTINYALNQQNDEILNRVPSIALTWGNACRAHLRPHQGTTSPHLPMCRDGSLDDDPNILINGSFHRPKMSE